MLCCVVLEEQEGAHIRGNFEVCRRSKIVTWYARLEQAMMKEGGGGFWLVESHETVVLIFCLRRSFSTGAALPPSRHLAMSGDVFVLVRTGWQVLLTSSVGRGQGSC